MYCAHLAVHVPGYNYTFDGQYYSTWGFVMHYIHWTNLKLASGIDQRFKEKGMHYLLTRTDFSTDPVTGMEMINVSSRSFCSLKRQLVVVKSDSVLKLFFVEWLRM